MPANGVGYDDLQVGLLVRCFGASALIALGALLYCGEGSAQQVSIGVVPGLEARWGDNATYRGGIGLWGDVLYGRSRGKAFGMGPFLTGWTSFRGSYAGTGLSVLVPVQEDMPLVLSIGGEETFEGGVRKAGVLGSVFWGLRSVNLSSWYSMTYGLCVQGRRDFRGDGGALTVGVQVDGEGLALPFILLWNAFR